MQFAPVGSRIAFIGQRDGRYTVVVDRDVSECFNGIGGLSFSPDGKRIAFAALDGTHVYCVVDNKRGKPYNAIGEIVFSPDGRRVAFSAKFDDKWFAVVDEKEDGPYDWVGSLVFSPNSEHLAYAVVQTTGDRSCVVVDAKQKKWHDGLVLINSGKICFCGNTAVSYVAFRGKGQRGIKILSVNQGI